MSKEFVKSKSIFIGSLSDFFGLDIDWGLWWVLLTVDGEEIFSWDSSTVKYCKIKISNKYMNYILNIY